MTLVMDLRDRRESKMRTSIQKFVGQVSLKKCLLNESKTQITLGNYRSCHIEQFDSS